MTDQRVFCCPGCRLLQAPTEVCVECGLPAFWIEAGEGVLRWRQPDDVQRKKGGIVATAASLGVTGVGMAVAGAVLGGWVVLPFLPLVAYGSLLGTAGVVSIRARQHGATVAVDLAKPITADGAIARTGVARALTGPIAARTSDAPVLVEQIVITRKGGLLFRAVRATPFLVEVADAPAFAVAGQLRLERTHETQRRPASDPLFAALGIPATVLPAKVDVEVQVVRPGDALTVLGVLEDTTLPELAFHRDGGQLQVSHGRQGAIVVIRAAS